MYWGILAQGGVSMDQAQQGPYKNDQGPIFPLKEARLLSTVEALVTDTLVSGQLYLWPPCLKPRFNSHTDSVFLHSRKRTFP